MLHISHHHFWDNSYNLIHNCHHLAHWITTTLPLQAECLDLQTLSLPHTAQLGPCSVKCIFQALRILDFWFYTTINTQREKPLMKAFAAAVHYCCCNIINYCYNQKWSWQKGPEELHLLQAVYMCVCILTCHCMPYIFITIVCSCLGEFTPCVSGLIYLSFFSFLFFLFLSASCPVLAMTGPSHFSCLWSSWIWYYEASTPQSVHRQACEREVTCAGSLSRSASQSLSIYISCFSHFLSLALPLYIYVYIYISALTFCIPSLSPDIWSTNPNAGWRILSDQSLAWTYSIARHQVQIMYRLWLCLTSKNRIQWLQVQMIRYKNNEHSLL